VVWCGHTVLYSIFKQKGLELVIAKMLSTITNDRLGVLNRVKMFFFRNFITARASFEGKATASTHFEI